MHVPACQGTSHQCPSCPQLCRSPHPDRPYPAIPWVGLWIWTRVESSLGWFCAQLDCTQLAALDRPGEGAKLAAVVTSCQSDPSLPFAGLEDTKDLVLKFTFNPKDGIDNPALSLAEDTDRDNEGQPRFYLLSRSPSEIFGFYLRTELGHPGHVIRQLEAGGPAQRQGLKDGDRLLQVNGEDVDSMEHLRVVQKIKASGTRVSVTVLDGSTYKVAKTLGRDVGAMLPGIARPRLCYITKDKSGFGFSVSAPEGVKGTFRLSVVHDGPADRAGVPDGSWLLELNGASVKNCSYAQLSRKLKQSGGQVTLLVLDAADEELCRRRGLRVTAAMADASRLPFRVRKLHMVKGPKGYGFLLQEEPGCSTGIGQFLREVDVGLPAERAGMREGDRLLAVNGKSVEELDHQQIVLLIRASGPQVTLLVIDAQGNAFFNAIGLSPLLFYEDQDAASGAHASSPGLPHTPCHNPHAGGPQDITSQRAVPCRHHRGRAQRR
ncbi:PREDICTED: Na(+)/H(+) exchange regulatory cofactor NHE-RF4 isoform X3 [Crocodylus porosus]|uniref:Na(+)/H(+) exchange regulatory cofactor NHE-RF4 isoform X3 n=1 Tax=Crocodylus porosus TaxID=8502 RepID=UPI00093E9E2E|nr:PREDICTED: Na(+)/H(+) exchange regulatory cofactor NHE-RF4 isoform X3 [Crocodylus porosus]